MSKGAKTSLDSIASPSIVKSYAWKLFTQSDCKTGHLYVNRCYDEEYCTFFGGTWITDANSELFLRIVLNKTVQTMATAPMRPQMNHRFGVP